MSSSRPATGCRSALGEITRVLPSLGHDVTSLDVLKALLARARAKHAGKDRLRFVLAVAETAMEPGGAFDAIVCRHRVRALTDPAMAFAEGRRVLKPGGPSFYSTATGPARRGQGALLKGRSR